MLEVYVVDGEGLFFGSQFVVLRDLGVSSEFAEVRPDGCLIFTNALLISLLSNLPKYIDYLVGSSKYRHYLRLVCKLYPFFIVQLVHLILKIQV